MRLSRTNFRRGAIEWLGWKALYGSDIERLSAGILDRIAGGLRALAPLGTAKLATSLLAATAPPQMLID